MVATVKKRNAVFYYWKLIYWIFFLLISANPILEFIKESPKAAAALWEGSVTESVLKVVFDGFDKMTKDVPISDIGNY